MDRGAGKAFGDFSHCAFFAIERKRLWAEGGDADRVGVQGKGVEDAEPVFLTRL